MGVEESNGRGTYLAVKDQTAWSQEVTCIYLKKVIGLQKDIYCPRPAEKYISLENKFTVKKSYI